LRAVTVIPGTSGSARLDEVPEPGAELGSVLVEALVVGVCGTDAQLAAIAIAADMKIEELALVPFSFPTYANAVGRAAVLAANKLDPPAGQARARVGDEACVA
jgi:hypothetical protein